MIDIHRESQALVVYCDSVILFYKFIQIKTFQRLRVFDFGNNKRNCSVETSVNLNVT